MTDVVFYFQVHQPYRLARDRRTPFDDRENRRIVRRVAELARASLRAAPGGEPWVGAGDGLALRVTGLLFPDELGGLAELTGHLTPDLLQKEKWMPRLRPTIHWPI